MVGRPDMMQHSGRVEVRDVTGPERRCHRQVKQWRIFSVIMTATKHCYFSTPAEPSANPISNLPKLIVRIPKLRSAEGEKDRNLSGFRLGFRSRFPIIAQSRAIRTG